MNLKLFFFILFISLSNLAIAQDDCICPQIYDPVCAQDSSGNIFEMPNLCMAECFGMVVVDDSLCVHYNPWEDCDCPDEYEPVCVQDSSGFYFEMPNACWAECFGYTIVTDSLCDYYNPWGACNCEMDDEAPFICASDSLGNFFYVPNECFASCLGLTVVAEDECDILVIDQEVDPVLIACLDSLNYDDVTTFQQAILLIHNECGLELPECILNAPLFDDDEAFIQYILENCGNFFGIGEDYSGSNILNLFNTLSNRMTTDAEEITNDAISEIKLLTNPAQTDLRFRIKTGNSEQVNLVLTNVNGQIVKMESRQINAGEQVYSLDISEIQPGLYILQCTGYHLNGSLKVIKM